MIDIRLPLLKKVKVTSDKHQNYAPFGSLVTRSKKPYKTIELPGPGQYNIARPIIVPLVQTVKKKNNNIIVKINDVGSAVFKYEKDRFKNQTVDNNNNLGPGQYYSISLDRKASKSNISKPNSLQYYKQKFKEVFNHKKNDTIPALKVLQKLLPQQDEQIKQINSLNYNQKLKQKGPIWSKFTQQRFKQLPDNKVPGPGAYDNLLYERKMKIKKESSMFASESIRSFFDNIYFNTNQQTKAIIRQKINFKSESPGPGSYNINSQKKINQNKFQFFNSTEKRLLQEAQFNQAYGKQERGFTLQELRESLKNLQDLKKSQIKDSNKRKDHKRSSEQVSSQRFDHLLSIRNSKSIPKEMQELMSHKRIKDNVQS